MTYLRNAFSHITNEEKNRSYKMKLTSVQKNRIALKYVRYRENQEIKRDYEENEKKKKEELNIVDVTGGYDEAIERYVDL